MNEKKYQTRYDPIVRRRVPFKIKNGKAKSLITKYEEAENDENN